MVLKLIQTPVRSISCHEKTERPFVRSTRILLEESWGDKRLKDKPTPKVDAEAGRN
jgi:hypothetical protein